MGDKVKKKSEIKIDVGVDENNVPLEMFWSATDGDVKDKEAKAMMLAMWDEAEKNTLRIDLWTKEMLVDDMKQFMHQTLLTMTETFHRATGEDRMAAEMQQFCRYFAEQMELIDPEEPQSKA